MKSQIKEKVINLISTITNNDISYEGKSDANLVDLGITSVDIVKLLVYVENEFDIEFTDEFLGTANLTSLDEIVDIVYDLLEEK